MFHTFRKSLKILKWQNWEKGQSVCSIENPPLCWGVIFVLKIHNWLLLRTSLQYSNQSVSSDNLACCPIFNQPLLPHVLSLAGATRGAMSCHHAKVTAIAHYTTNTFQFSFVWHFAKNIFRCAFFHLRPMLLVCVNLILIWKSSYCYTKILCED